jgi:SAM-dependent methyltransferase
MRDVTATLLRCPRCDAEGSLRIEARERDDREVRTGTLACSACGRTATVTRGVADLLDRPPDHVVREAAGLGRFADFMRGDGWDVARVLNLPEEPSPYWYSQRLSFHALLERVDFRPGQRLLDVGANTCWASAAFAARGLDVVALDISLHELQGLYTADFWMDDRGVFFERLLAPMFDLPLRTASLDHVFCCEVLHHNDRRSLRRTFAEIHRVLKPGGVLSVVNETMRFPLAPNLHPGHEVADFEGYEHAFLFSSYWRAARRAGFHVEVVEPAYHWIFRDEPLTLDASTGLKAGVRLAWVNFCRRKPRLRRAYLHWLNLVRGGVQLSLVCRKPDS